MKCNNNNKSNANSLYSKGLSQAFKLSQENSVVAFRLAVSNKRLADLFCLLC